MPSPQIAHHIFLVVTLFFLLKSFSRKIYFACAYLLILMYRPSLYYPLLEQIRFELVVAVIGVFLLCISGVGERLARLKENDIARSMFIFWGVIIVAMPLAFNFSVSWEWVYDVVLPNALLTILILVFCKNKSDINIYLWTLMVVLAGVGYEAFFRYFTGDVVDINSAGTGGFQYAITSQGRASGHVGLANYFLLGIPAMWYTGCNSNKVWVKLSAFGLLAYSFVGVLISGSRGGLVGLIVILGVITFLSAHRFFFGAGAVLLILISLPLMGGEYLVRMATILEMGGDGLSSSSRISGLVNGIEMMINRPLLGVGPGCYPVARKAWFGWYLWAHNHYGQLAGELGIIGVIAWYRFAKNYIKKSWSIMKLVDVEPWVKNTASIIFVTSVLLLALGMFTHSLYKFIWFNLAALVVILEELLEKSDHCSTR